MQNRNWIPNWGCKTQMKIETKNTVLLQILFSNFHAWRPNGLHINWNFPSPLPCSLTRSTKGNQWQWQRTVWVLQHKTFLLHTTQWRGGEAKQITMWDARFLLSLHLQFPQENTFVSTIVLHSNSLALVFPLENKKQPTDWATDEWIK